MFAPVCDGPGMCAMQEAWLSKERLPVLVPPELLFLLAVPAAGLGVLSSLVLCCVLLGHAPDRADRAVLGDDAFMSPVDHVVGGTRERVLSSRTESAGDEGLDQGLRRGLEGVTSVVLYSLYFSPPSPPSARFRM